MLANGYANVVARAIAALAVAALAFTLIPAASADAAGRKFGSRTLKTGSQGRDVKVLQRWLTRVGFRTVSDGTFGPGTESSLRRWEKLGERAIDGRLSRGDANALRRDVLGSDAVTGGTAFSNPVPPPPAVQGKAQLAADGTAVAPADAPPQVKAVIAAANEIATKPYRYGGGHGRWNDTGYDCSGSVSYALHGGDLLESSMPSGGFMRWGAAGRGTWITTYAHEGHMYMVVAGLRFDTSGRGQTGSRWQTDMRSSRGFSVRHPPGL